MRACVWMGSTACAESPRPRRVAGQPQLADQLRAHKGPAKGARRRHLSVYASRIDTTHVAFIFVCCVCVINCVITRHDVLELPTHTVCVPVCRQSADLC